MALSIPHTWIYFFICLVIMIAAQFIMAKQGKHFFYGEERTVFSMLQLEFPKYRLFDYAVFSGINKLPQAEADDVKKYLRGQLWVDYLMFMPFTYTGVFLICMQAALTTSGALLDILVVLAWCQFGCWLLDITENTYFLMQIRKPKQPSPFGFFCFRMMEALKWGPSTGGFLLSIIVLILHRF